MQQDATQRNATRRNATRRNAKQRNAKQQTQSKRKANAKQMQRKATRRTAKQRDATQRTAGWTALHVAASAGNAAAVSTLIGGDSPPSTRHPVAVALYRLYIGIANGMSIARVCGTRNDRLGEGTSTAIHAQ